MKKQYKAPSIEIELHGISNFCAGCGVTPGTTSEWMIWSLEASTCFQDWLAGVEHPDVCYNSPNDSTSGGSNPFYS